MRLFKCQDGTPVPNAADAHPALSGIVGKENNIPLLQSDDGGSTWSKVGFYAWNWRFGGYDSFPTWL